MNSYETVRAAVAEVFDPRRLAYVVLAHFEPDGFLGDAPSSVLVASELGATVNLAHWATGDRSRECAMATCSISGVTA